MIRSEDASRNTALYPGNLNRRRRSRRAWALALIKILQVYLRHRLKGRSARWNGNQTERPYILLFTYDLHNLGNQALVFSAVSHLKQKFPHKEIHVMVFRREEMPAYSFQVHQLQVEDKARLLCRRSNHPQKTILEQSCLAMDVSGLIFSHAMGWKLSVHFLLNLMLAREYGIPFVVYPQTLGPLDFPPLLRRWLHLLAVEYLSGAEKVFVRERAGLAHLQPLNLNNLELSPDAVLASPPVTPGLVYAAGDSGESTFPRLEKDTAAWVPNVRFNERISTERMRALNHCGISAMLTAGLRVLVLCHSPSDRRAGREAAGLFTGEERVTLLENPPDAIQVVELLGRCRFIVSQRYHAIVHGLKAGTPAVALSWDDKYRELYTRFGMDAFCLDIRSGFDLEELRAAISAMSLQAESLRGCIAAGLSELSIQPVWDCVDRVLTFGENEDIRRPA